MVHPKDQPPRVAGFDPTKSTGGADWVPAKADRGLAFIETCCTHTKGKMAGQRLILAPWQADWVRNLYGWIRPDGTRRFREAAQWVARKNGKSTLGAAIGLHLLCMDDEAGAEVYSAACDRAQAKIVHQVAKRMIYQEPELKKRLRIYRDSILHPSSDSSYHAISSDSASKHGYNASGILFDELHAQRDRELFDVLTTSTASREQPLNLTMSTAGSNQETIGFEQWDYAMKVRNGEIDDPSFLPAIYQAPIGCDIDDRSAWAEANPNLGVSVKLEYLERELVKAKRSPTYEATFRTLHLNQWVAQANAWISLIDWDACTGPTDWKQLQRDLVGRKCYGGLDLSATQDLTSFVLAVPLDDGDGNVALLAWNWAPEYQAQERSKRDRFDYIRWSKRGDLKLTPGKTIDYDVVRADIVAICRRYRVHDVAYDPWNATETEKLLSSHGIKMVQMRQGYASMSAPCKRFDDLAVTQHLVHGGQRVLRWCVSNATVSRDPAGNVKLDKKRSTDRIDAAVAGVMALDRMIRNADVQSDYGGTGLRTL